MRRRNSHRHAWCLYVNQRRKRVELRQAGILRERRARQHRRGRLQAEDTLLAPADFNLFATHSTRTASVMAFHDFMTQLRGFRRTHLVIDLSQVQRMHVSGTLLFKAEISHLIARGCNIDALAPAKERVRQVLQQTGLATLLRLNLKTIVDREDVVHWRHASGSYDLMDSEAIGNMLVNDNDIMAESLYRGAVESVANCVEHAYKTHAARRPMVKGQEGWWAFQQIREGMMTVCVCDLGIGVANALPLKLTDEPGLLKQLLYAYRHTKGRDRKAMLAAMDYRRSSTRSPHRGRGMRDLTSVIDAVGCGVFMWLSHSGMLQYNRESASATPKKSTHKLGKSIHGTICMWRFPIQSQVTDAASALE